METSNTNVLIVTDDRPTGATLVRVLETAGMRGATIRRHRSVPAVLIEEDVAVVVVIHSVGRLASTVSITTRLRARPEPAVSDVAILAVVDTPADAAFGLDHVADSVILRPFDAKEFVAAVKDLATSTPTHRRLRRDTAALQRA